MLDEPASDCTFSQIVELNWIRPTLISFSMLIFALYLHFITATAENPASHKCDVENEHYHLEEDIHLFK